jgi:hypothetical protein
MKTETVLTGMDYLYRAQADWDHNPPYQRPGGQWGLKQKQKFIDSLLNNFPVPPIYLHRNGRSCAVIDGKQRLETIREFIDGKFQLASDFALLEAVGREDSAPRRGDGYASFTPAWRAQLLSYTFAVVEVSFGNHENASALVRQIFLRLNSGTKIAKRHMQEVRSQLMAGVA